MVSGVQLQHFFVDIQDAKCSGDVVEFHESEESACATNRLRHPPDISTQDRKLRIPFNPVGIFEENWSCSIFVTFNACLTRIYHMPVNLGLYFVRFTETRMVAMWSYVWR